MVHLLLPCLHGQRKVTLDKAAYCSNYVSAKQLTSAAMGKLYLLHQRWILRQRPEGAL